MCQNDHLDTVGVCFPKRLMNVKAGVWVGKPNQSKAKQLQVLARERSESKSFLNIKNVATFYAPGEKKRK